MSNGEIHEISLEIGKLISGLDAIKNEVQAFRSEMHDHVTATDKTLKELTDLKSKGAGILLAVSLVASGLASAFYAVWQYLRGH